LASLEIVLVLVLVVFVDYGSRPSSSPVVKKANRSFLSVLDPARPLLSYQPTEMSEYMIVVGGKMHTE
jgi:hypothetical protein